MSRYMSFETGRNVCVLFSFKPVGTRVSFYMSSLSRGRLSAVKLFWFLIIILCLYPGQKILTEGF